jgi:two-component system, OmpR family, phosphate regulon sensor histidine kinase PhoR
MENVINYDQLVHDINRLRQELEEANDALDAIRTGQVDALIVQGSAGPQVYSLKNADHAYRVFIETMNEGALTLNREGIILYCNSRFAAITGIALAKLIGLPFYIFISPEQQVTWGMLCREGWKADSKGELFIMDKHKTPVPFLLSMKTLELDEGVCLSVILTDLTPQKEIQRQLKQKNDELEQAHLIMAGLNNELEEKVKIRTKDLLMSREYFKFLADNIPVLVWTADQDGHLNYFNKRWQEYAGLELRESKGMEWLQFLHPGDLDNFTDTWAKAVVAGQRLEMEYRIRRISDGQYRWHLGYAQPLKDQDGKIAAWFGTSIDIQDQKTALEKKDEFIGIASHELRTPLTSLKAYIQLITVESGGLPPEINQYVGKANESINKLQNLIRDLLDVSKIQSGKLAFTCTSLNLVDLIRTCMGNARHIFPSSEIELHANKDCIVQGNAERLEQVVMNLIGNAVKYSPQSREVAIDVRKGKGLVRVSVRDHGIGLSEENAGRIFERFYRVNHNFVAGGLGMGLYISSEIIKAHQGTIGVKSKMGEGSTFYFDLPLTE